MGSVDSKKVEKDGITWVLTAGIASVFVAALLWYIDDSMTYSPVPERQYQELKDLRSAQSGLDSGRVDPR